MNLPKFNRKNLKKNPFALLSWGLIWIWCKFEVDKIDLKFSINYWKLTIDWNVPSLSFNPMIHLLHLLSHLKNSGKYSIYVRYSLLHQDFIQNPMRPTWINAKVKEERVWRNWCDTHELKKSLDCNKFSFSDLLIPKHSHWLLLNHDAFDVTLTHNMFWHFWMH